MLALAGVALFVFAAIVDLGPGVFPFMVVANFIYGVSSAGFVLATQTTAINLAPPGKTALYVNALMVKTADVAVVNVLTVYNRVVCTLIQGVVGAVQEALHAGRERASSSEHFLCSALIPQPVPEVLQAFGVRY